MAYTNYNTKRKVIVASTQRWYRFVAFCQMITLLETVNLSVHKSKADALARLDSLNTSAPFAEDTQFTQNVDFIYDNGIIHSNLISIRSILMSKTRTGNNRDNGSDDTKNFNDQTLNYLHALEGLRQALISGDQIYNRATFEADFDITWA
jgi:hypothetical protein